MADAGEPVMVEVSLESFIEDLWAVGDGDHEFGELTACEEMVRVGMLPTCGGIGGVLEMFDNMDVVTRDMYEERFPIYSTIFSWDEFVENECRWGNDRIAVVDKEG